MMQLMHDDGRLAAAMYRRKLKNNGVCYKTVQLPHMFAAALIFTESSILRMEGPDYFSHSRSESQARPKMLA